VLLSYCLSSPVQPHISLPSTAPFVLARVRVREFDRTRGIITHGPAHRGASGSAMPTCRRTNDEGDQHDFFFSFSHPEREGGGVTSHFAA